MSTIPADRVSVIEQYLTAQYGRLGIECVKAVTDVSGINGLELVELFRLTAEPDRRRFLNYLNCLDAKPPRKMLSLELGNRERGLRVSIGHVYISDDSLVLLKRHDQSSEKSFGLSTHFLEEVKRKTRELLPEVFLPLLEILGWINEVAGNVVRICYYDEDKEFYFADVPRERFHRFSDLTEGMAFRIQTWEQGSRGCFDLLPIPETDPAKRRAAMERALARVKHGLEKTPVPSQGEPLPPRDYSDRADVLRYYRELDERYKHIDWGKGTRP
jgi:hypothetical protein